MQQTVWAVDGSFFAQRISGIQRYSIELLAALDEMAPAGLVELVVPPQVKAPAYQNIKVVPFGTRQGLAWQQLDYPCYLKRRSAKGLATCNVIPWFGFTGIAVVHDVCYRARPDFYTDPRGCRSSLNRKLLNITAFLRQKWTLSTTPGSRCSASRPMTVCLPGTRSCKRAGTISAWRTC